MRFTCRPDEKEACEGKGRLPSGQAVFLMWLLELEVLWVKAARIEIRRGAGLAKQRIIEVLWASALAVRSAAQGTDRLPDRNAVVEAVGAVWRNRTAKGQSLLFLKHLHHLGVVYTISVGNASQGA